jgi:ubiquinone/menaquinone biosynthesis C-methylase UbiE
MNVSFQTQKSNAPSNRDASELFQKEWSTYRKMVDNNYLFHAEVCHSLHRILAERGSPFHMLDIACGDAGTTARALDGTLIAKYTGVDLSQPALEIALDNLHFLNCPVELFHAEFNQILKNWSEPVDVVWIGLSLHHFRTPQKLSVMREARRILKKEGLFVIYENASPTGEKREDWMKRWDQQKSSWKAFSSKEWEAMALHVHENDFPETAPRWLKLGHDAGFTHAEEIFVSPSNLFRMYCFRE